MKARCTHGVVWYRPCLACSPFDDVEDLVKWRLRGSSKYEHLGNPKVAMVRALFDHWLDDFEERALTEAFNNCTRGLP